LNRSDRDVLFAERAIALAVAREVERNDRDLLAPRAAPDVNLGPIEQRMDADVLLVRYIGMCGRRASLLRSV
jgi:hypothetical protein